MTKSISFGSVAAGDRQPTFIIAETIQVSPGSVRSALEDLTHEKRGASRSKAGEERKSMNLRSLLESGLAPKIRRDDAHERAYSDLKALINGEFGASLSARFEPGNRKLSHRYDLQLSELGY